MANQRKNLINIQTTGFGSANNVVARTSYTAYEIIEGAKFKSMYQSSDSGNATFLYIDKLNSIERVSLPTPVVS